MFWILWVIAPLIGFALFGFAVSRVLRRNDVADLLWGLGFILFATLHAMAAPIYTSQSSLLLGLLTLWGLRLSIFLAIRNLGKPEDRRYAEWRKNWGKSEPFQAMGKVFLFQSLLLLIIVSPILISLHQPEFPWGIHTVVGVSLFVFGFVFEWIADAQLFAFKKDPENRGKVLQEGLWAFCRHPNYFGEILIWWGFYALSFTPSYWHVQLVGPVLLTFLLAKFSGVPMLEKSMKEKGEAFKTYAQKTPALIPIRPKGLKAFLGTFTFFILMDLLWLSVLMEKFYITELHHLARMKGNSFDAIPWAVMAVYLVMSLGIAFLAEAKTRSQSVFKGAILGFSIYATYELTNYAIVADWPLRVVVVDILWGTILCASASWVYAKMK